MYYVSAKKDDDLMDDGDFITERQPDLTDAGASELDRQVALVVLGTILILGGIVFGVGSAIL